ncbi:MAG: EAL domain-containing protein [Gammaproteobacteria bacterium]|nr:EAL domain-containing protein [Gammaproteobacteria bacterium]MBU1624801.1 EAL domain-containing protein [Gammaproteobacteria bacterium]MBU1982645.1 EAL domain-containing protein [Gammaproteobacteria bacterium]
MRLIDIATRDVTTCLVQSNLADVAGLMAQRRFSSIVVTDDTRHPVGIITERNILRAMHDGIVGSTALQEVMSAPVIVMSGDTLVLEGYRTCQREGIRHLVLVDEAGVVSGVVSETDFRQHLDLTVLAGRRRISTIAQRTGIAMPPETLLKQALDLMDSQHKSCVIVVAEDKPLGIVTERDVVRIYSSKTDWMDTTLGDVMISPVLTITVNSTTSEAAEKMLVHKVRHLVVVDANGNMTGMVSEHDLTQLMAKGLNDQRAGIEESFLHGLLDAIPDLIWLKDVDGHYLACNHRFESFFGARERDIVGKTDHDFVDKALADFFREHDQMAMAADKPTINEEWITFADDGHRELLETIKTPMHDRSGKLVGVLGVGRDITERERIKHILAESEHEFRSLAENLPDNIIRYDRECRVTYMNPSMARTIAAHILPVVGEFPVDAAPDSPEVRELQDLVTKVMDKGERVEVEYPIEHPDGGLHWHHVIFVPERDKEGMVIGALGIGRDINERKQVEQALKDSIDNYSELVQKIPVGVYKYRMLAQGGGVFDYVSQRWCELLDVKEHDVLRDPHAAFSRILPDDLEEFRWLNDNAREQMHPLEWEGRIKRRDGEVRWLHIASQPTRMENGDILWDGIQYDITDRRRADESLRINASVFDNSQEAIVVTDANNRIIDVNAAFTTITGYTRAEVMGKNPNILSSGRQDQAFYGAMWQALQEKGAWRGEIWNRRKSGEVFAEMLSISVIADHLGQVQRHVGIFSDITYFKDHEAELSHVANYDALTGVPNRRLLADRLRQAIAVTQRSDAMLAVCYIDLDGFKEVNDRHGHEMGDKLLIDITRRLQEVLRAGDTLARLGGDEFVMLFNELPQVDECYRVLERVMDVIGQPVVLNGIQVFVSASIGVTLYPEDHVDGDTLLRHADQAMYIAKQSGKNRFHLYDAMHDQRVRSLHEGRRRISEGLEGGEFELYYQPKQELSTGNIVGVEALIRWNHPERGILAPAEFLPIIENSEQDVQLGKWVINNALAQLFAWERAGLALQVSINISAQHLQISDFVENLKNELSHYPKLRDGALQIEVLETAALEDIAQSSEVIDACREMGVTFALDDFGTGYSSLVYLSRLSADTLKIDQSFVQGMSLNKGDHAIVQGVIALANTFGRHTVAEGVEDGALNSQLQAMGCGSVQGYSIAQPMPAGEVADWIKQRKV